VAHILAIGKTLKRDAVVLVNLSGRGDKDVASVAEALR
jgi:tryptophan synthase beta subunit